MQKTFFKGQILCQVIEELNNGATYTTDLYTRELIIRKLTKNASIKSSNKKMAY